MSAIRRLRDRLDLWPEPRVERRVRRLRDRFDLWPEPRLEFGDIQGNVLSGYGHPRAAYTFVRVDDAAEGRSLVGDLAERVTSALRRPEGRPPDVTWNLALTYQGLAALGVPSDVLHTFPDDFREGMAGRADLLGDVGDSAPERWEAGLGTGEAHLLVMVNAREQDGLDTALDELHARLDGAGGGLAVVHEQRAELLPFEWEEFGPREHFGFSDGFSQPSVRGHYVAPRPGQGVPVADGQWRPLAAGEFLLGYEDEDNVLPEAPARPLAQNGTFMIYRKLYQDVALFRRTLREAARVFARTWDLDEGYAEELLAAKVVGRWRDGTPLVRSPEHDDPANATDKARLNDFRYDQDPDGLACPLGAHIRRTNPRDALGWGGKRSLRHRVIRRGMPYGPPLPADADDDGTDRGLLFICFNASIVRQFEVIQAQWCNHGNAFGLGDDTDWLLGENRNTGRPEEGRGKMIVQGRPPFMLSPQPPFVTTRGGEYLFLPGINALRALAVPWPGRSASGALSRPA